MSILQHLWELALFLIIFLAPVPLCLLLLSSIEDEDRSSDLAYNWLAFLICWCGLEVSVCLISGIFGQFFLNFVIGLEAIVFFLGITLALLLRRNLLSTFYQRLLVLREPLKKVEVLVLFSIFITGLISLKQLATRVIIDYDSLWYHLPTMARWYQEGAFIRLDDFMRTGVWTTDQITFYPYNWEVLCTLFLMPFREDFLVTLPNLIAWFVLGLSVYLLSISLGANRFYGMAASALVLNIPLIIQHINSLHIDMPFAAFFMASLFFAGSYSRSCSYIDLSLFFIALGMLLGIKMSAVGYGALPILALLMLITRRLLKGGLDVFKLKQVKLEATVIVIGLLGLFFLGGYWYLKNWIEAGNPLGDIQVKVANVLLFPGSMELSKLRETNLASLFSFTNLAHWKILGVQAIVRLQLPFFILLFQALLLPYLLFNKQRKIQDPFLLGVLLVVLFGAGYLYWTTPFTGTNHLPPVPITSYIGQQARFAIPFMGMLGVIAAAVATGVRPRPSVVAVITLVSSLLGFVSSTIFEIVRISTAFKGGVGWASKLLDSFRTTPADATEKLFKIVGPDVLDVIVYILIYIIVLALVIWSFSRSQAQKVLVSRISKIFQKSNRFVFVSVLIALVVTTSFIAREKRDMDRQEVYGGIYEYIATNLNPSEILGYSLSYRSYLFYGKHWQQKVRYAAPQSESLSQWLNELNQNQIVHIAVGPLEEKMGWREKSEILWLENSSGPFKQVFGQSPQKGPAIYQLKDFPS